METSPSSGATGVLDGLERLPGRVRSDRTTTILAAIHHRGDTEAVFAGAVRRARDEDAELVIAYLRPLLDPAEVFDPQGCAMERQLDDAGGEALRGVTVRMLELETWGDPAARICDLARQEEADMVVVSDPRNGRRGLLRRIRRHAPCRVEAVDQGRKTR